MRVRSKRRFLRTSSVAAIAWAAVYGPALAQAVPPPGVPQTPAMGVPLQLEVIRNGEPTGLIAAVRQRADGQLAATPAEIQAVGLVAPPVEGEVLLKALPGVDYRYDEAEQRLYLTAIAAAVAPTVISLRATPQRTRNSQDWGALLNYSLAMDAGGRGWSPHLSGGSGAFEARAFGRFGLLSTGMIATLRRSGASAVRLDTTWMRGRPDDVAAGRAGDLISSGLAWTRPVRMGGLQFGRDFATRPDIVTAPTPDLAITAAAPSTLDVMLGDSVLLSRRVSAGPVQVTDLPTYGQGQARLVLRDPGGMEHAVSASYFATPQLLRPGLLDFSMEVAVSAPLNLALMQRWGDVPAFAVTYAHADTLATGRRDLLTATVRYTLYSGLSLQAAAYAGRAKTTERGFFLAVTAPLGGGRVASAGIDRSERRSAAFVEARQQEQLEPGAVGWRLRADRTGDSTGLSAEGVYRSNVARLSGRVAHFGGVTEVNARADGALVWMGAPFAAADRIEGAFAAVDVGASDVDVRFQHRRIGSSGRDGRILVTGLNAYESNLLDIDADDLPLASEAPSVRLSVSPPYGAGANVKFGVRAAPLQFLLRLRVGQDAPPPGARASVNGGPFDQTVGYDGELFLGHAQTHNTVTLDLGSGESCSAVVDIEPQPGMPHAANVDCR